MIEETKKDSVCTEEPMEEAEQIAPAETRESEPRSRTWRTARPLRRREHRDLWHRLNTKMLAIRVAVATSILFLLTCVLAVFLYLQLQSTERQYAEEMDLLAQQSALLGAEKERALLELGDLKSERDLLKGRLTSLNEELDRVKQERDELIKNDAVITALQAEIDDLKNQLAEKEARIAALEKRIYRENELDLKALLPKLQSIQELLENGAPMHTVSVEKKDEYGKPYFEDEEHYPNLSLFVFDSLTGLSYRWQVGKTYDSGTLRYLIYATALLERASEEQGSLSEGAGDVTLHYDLSRVYTLRREDVMSGSGILKNAEPGSTYTHLDLIRILLSYCDATAYHVLHNSYGDDVVTLLLSGIEGITAVEPDKLTASDYLLILRRTVGLIESDSPYAADLKDALTAAVSTHYSQATQGTVGRQYSSGEEGYHELGIRFGEDGALMVVLMSDMTNRSSEWSTYLTTVYRQINELMDLLRG